MREDRRMIRNMHIGHKKAFKGWKLIWEDGKKINSVHVVTISETLAKDLKACGMSEEG